MTGMLRPYPTDVSNEILELIRPFIEIKQTNGRPREDGILREVVNALFYMDRTGCQWNMIPHDLPPKSTVWYLFSKWKKDGVLKQILDQANRTARVAAGRDESPSLGIVDSQSVKTAHGGDEIGFDAFKRVKGRKRHLFVDIMGLLFAVVVTAANVPDGKILVPLTEKVEAIHPRLEAVLADGAYGIANYPSVFAQRFQDRETPLHLRISKKDPDQKGFKVIPKRWVVERTNAWNGNSRRLSKDYERTVASSEAFVIIAAIARTGRALSTPS